MEHIEYVKIRYARNKMAHALARLDAALQRQFGECSKCGVLRQMAIMLFDHLG